MKRPLYYLSLDVYTIHRQRWLKEMQQDTEFKTIAYVVVLGIIITMCLMVW
jgi:hypothetical protein